MRQLLELMDNGRAWSVEELAEKLGTSPEDVKRQMEFLEQTGLLYRVGGCGHSCSGCSSHCQGVESGGLSGMPVFWQKRGKMS